MKLALLLILPVHTFAYLPQFYQTSDITPGEKNLTFSIAPELYTYNSYESDTSVGGQIQLSCRYALKSKNKLAIVGYLGGLIGSPSPLLELQLVEDPPISLLPVGGIGLQAEVMDNPAVSGIIAIEYPSLFSMAIVLGLCSRKTGREIFTVGLKTANWYPGTLFVNFHPTPRFHISVGGSIVYFGNEVHAGFAYTFLDRSEATSKVMEE